MLFGGETETEEVGDTWTYNGTKWIPLLSAHSPSARTGAAMAYDGADGQIVLYGGEDEVSGHADTWTYDGTDWVMQSPPASPSGRNAPAMAYDGATGEVVLFGGASLFFGFDDTWNWDGSSWTQASPATSPPARSGASMAYDAATGEIVLFGGLGADGHRRSDTWTWNGTDWTERNPAASPPARNGAGMAYDEESGRVVLFGGEGEGGTRLGDTWSWDGTDWTEESPTTSPPGRSYAGMAYDAALGRVVLFGGTGEVSIVGGHHELRQLGDTWSYRSVGAPRATIATPIGGQTYTVGAAIPTSFGCEDALGGTGIESCTDSGGSVSGAGHLDTATTGIHTYSVTARSLDGETAGSSITYTVVPAVTVMPPPVTPSATCTVPRVKGARLKGAKKRIRAADCGVGKPKRRGGATAKSGRIVAQSPRPGSSVPAGTKVKVTLAPVGRTR